jgi:uncharacterized damage-inducible protein DinB
MGLVTWTAPTPTPVDGPVVGDDRPMLEGYLAWQRATLLNICAGLTAEQLATRPIDSSNLSLLGLVRHLAKVERIWLRQRAAGDGSPPLFDPELGKDHDYDRIDPADAPAAFERLQKEWRAGDAAVADLPFDHPVDAGGAQFSLRMVYLHLIGEYARHNGHADLLRERLDGVTGR